MMPHAATALKLAIDLMHLPSQVRSIQSAPLPDGVEMLLRVVAGDELAIGQAVASTDRSRDVVREAAAFYVEQILLYQGADSYRVLGASAEASHAELRRNMALLLRWLHPDSEHSNQRAVFAARVTRAWNDLKTEERRAEYNRQLTMVHKSNLNRRYKRGSPLGMHRSKHRSSYAGTRRVSHRSPDVLSVGWRELLRVILLRVFDRSVL